MPSRTTEQASGSSTTPSTSFNTPSSNTSQGPSNPSARIKTEDEEAAERLYEERIEEEYAKREGGA